MSTGRIVAEVQPPQADRAMHDYFDRIEGDFVTNEAGDEVFWPTGNNGYYDSYVLRAIADELDKRNAPWNDRLEEWFENNPPRPCEEFSFAPDTTGDTK